MENLQQLPQVSLDQRRATEAQCFLYLTDTINRERILRTVPHPTQNRKKYSIASANISVAVHSSDMQSKIHSKKYRHQVCCQTQERCPKMDQRQIGYQKSETLYPKYALIAMQKENVIFSLS